jgi:DNA/RNA-binding domain of Phe-tRNA-synthetase-like protein
MVERVHISAEVRERFPGFRVSVVFAWGLHNGPSTSESRAWLRSATERGIACLEGRPAKEFPSLKNWRDAYSAFGAKPSAYPCSAEALIQRALKGGAQTLPSINALVDAYNAISLAHLMPVGGEDLDRIVGRCQLRIANPDDCRAEGEDASNAPHPGEVIWTDDHGWTCRRWNWRQGVRTRLTESTRNAFFLVEGMASSTYEPDMAAATEELCNRLGECFRPERLETEHIVCPAAAQAGRPYP